MKPADGEDGRFGNQLSQSVIGACIEVHRHLGPGLLESTYERCVCHELSLRGISFERQIPVPVTFKGVRLDCSYRVDLLVERRLVVELKAVESLLPIHQAQVLTYLKLMKLDTALLVNFNVPILKHGLRRLTRDRPSSRSSRPPVSLWSPRRS